MIKDSPKKYSVDIDFENSLQDVINLSPGDLKIESSNFTVFRSPHCSHPSSCLTHLLKGTLNTGFKSTAIAMLSSFILQVFFKNKK